MVKNKTKAQKGGKSGLIGVKPFASAIGLPRGQKGVFTMTKLWIGLLLFGLVMVTLGGAFYAVALDYDKPVSDRFSKYEDQMAGITNTTAEIGQQYQGGKLSGTDTFILSAETVYSGVQIMLGSLGIPLTIISNVYTDLPFIPKIFITVLTAILTLGFIYIASGVFARWLF